MAHLGGSGIPGPTKTRLVRTKEKTDLCAEGAAQVTIDSAPVSSLAGRRRRWRTKTKTDVLYDRHFMLWTDEQAAALRRCKDANLPLDWENVAEEIESLGKSDRRGMTSQIRRILRYLLKIEASPAAEPRAGWRSTVLNARGESEDILRDSPSLRRHVDATIAEQLALAGRLVELDLARRGESIDRIRARIRSGGFSANEVLGNWFPDAPG